MGQIVLSNKLQLPFHESRVRRAPVIAGIRRFRSRNALPSGGRLSRPETAPAPRSASRARGTNISLCHRSCRLKSSWSAAGAIDCMQHADVIAHGAI